MATQLSNLRLHEVSLVDRPANSEIDPLTGEKIPRARVALFKRDATPAEVAKELEEMKLAVDDQKEGFPRGDYAYTPDDVPSHWKLRLTRTPGGEPDAGIVGAAIAALGEGFRGNKVQIPAEALAGVKAKVRAAWRKANPDKGEAEMPEILRKADTMTLQEIEAKVTKMEAESETLKADNTSLKADNAFLKAENATILKMSKTERKAYAMMSEDERKAYNAADGDKRKAMMDAKCKEMAEKQLVDENLTPADREVFEKAGPEVRKALVAKAEELAKGKTAKAAPDDEEEEEEEMKTEKIDKKIDKAEVEKQVQEITKVHVMQIAGLNDRVAKAEDRVAKAEAELVAARKSEREARFTKIAEDQLRFTSGTPEAKGSMLMKAADAFGEESETYKSYFATLKAADAALAGHFTEVGKAHSGPLPAEKVLEAKAQEIAKRDKCDIGTAMMKACEENMDLYNEVNQQHRRAAVPA